MEISIALGGGGARGMAHLGVLKFLEEKIIKIGALAGTSLGGLVAAVYLSGNKATDLIDRFAKIDQPKLYRYQRGQEPALLGLGGAMEVLTELIGGSSSENLPIPFAIAAVDVETGQEIMINEGPVLDAVLATIAVPGILPALRWAGRWLVDGGAVPVDIARKLRPSIPVIAVVLSQPVGETHKLKVPEIPGASPVVDYISKLRIAQALEIFILSIEAGSKNLAEKRLELDKPDVLIRPLLEEIGLLDRLDVEQLAAIGYEATSGEMESIIALGSLGTRLRRIFRG